MGLYTEGAAGSIDYNRLRMAARSRKRALALGRDLKDAAQLAVAETFPELLRMPLVGPLAARFLGRPGESVTSGPVV